MYDQLGCGNSTHLPEKNGDCDFWTVSLFLSELSNLLTHLNIQNYDLLGQSWGGMLAACHAIRQPRGLHRLIIADSPASMDLWVEAADQLRAQLPAAVQEVLLKCEREGNTDSKEYEEAMEVYYDRHVCRVKPAPVEFQTSMDKLKEDQTVFLTMCVPFPHFGATFGILLMIWDCRNGPSEFFITGMLKTWSIVDEVYKINVRTLLINGKYDEAQDSVMEPFFRSIEKVKWVRFGESSHLPQLEEPEEFLKVVSSFLMTKG